MAQLAAEDVNHHNSIRLPNSTKMAIYINKAAKMAHFLHPSHSKNANWSKGRSPYLNQTRQFNNYQAFGSGTGPRKSFGSAWHAF
ncbi:hypothetical protein JCGZ_15531 [Jatropha curcas]|uniref:Uncharacterized protein n=1 Tax=Jatropha curcas TaxID=180498 RepID=A0A067KES7_JATCU|nr:hypothetical protein JCGZ_15531 [Jatropha curcas]